MQDKRREGKEMMDENGRGHVPKLQKGKQEVEKITAISEGNEKGSLPKCMREKKHVPLTVCLLVYQQAAIISNGFHSTL